jgi:hypothetical protein
MCRDGGSFKTNKRACGVGMGYGGKGSWMLEVSCAALLLTNYTVPRYLVLTRARAFWSESAVRSKYTVQ